MRSRSPRWPVLLLGVLLGMTIMALVPHGQLKLGSSLLGSATDGQGGSVHLARNASEVDTTHWKLYRDATLGYQMDYPPTYSLTADPKKATVELRPYEQVSARAPTSILLESIWSTPAKEVLPSMQLAGWKMAERKLYAISSPYFSEDGDRFWSEYLFMRDFPLKGGNERTHIIKATIQTGADNPELQAARKAGLADVESFLTTPEQILSTFHFLALEDIKLKPGQKPIVSE